MAVSKFGQSALAPDALGGFGVYQDFPICGRCAQASRKIYHAADGGVVKAVLVSDPSDCCRPTGKTNPEPDLVAS